MTLFRDSDNRVWGFDVGVGGVELVVVEWFPRPEAGADSLGSVVHAEEGDEAVDHGGEKEADVGQDRRPIVVNLFFLKQRRALINQIHGFHFTLKFKAISTIK